MRTTGIALAAAASVARSCSVIAGEPPDGGAVTDAICTAALKAADCGAGKSGSRVSEDVFVTRSVTRNRCFASTAHSGQAMTASMRKNSTVPTNVEAPDRLCTRSVKHQSYLTRRALVRDEMFSKSAVGVIHNRAAVDFGAD